MSFKQDVIVRLDKVADQQVQHTIQLARNSDILNEHHVRASNLESRIKPLESHVLVINSVIKIALSIIAAAAAIASVIHFFVK